MRELARTSGAQHSHGDLTLAIGSAKRISKAEKETPSSTARLAQSAERKALNLVVVGSSPTVGAFAKRLKLRARRTRLEAIRLASKTASGGLCVLSSANRARAAVCNYVWESALWYGKTRSRPRARDCAGGL